LWKNIAVIPLIDLSENPRPALTPCLTHRSSFAWKLTDQEVADVATYIRNSRSNHAAAVSVSDVRAARKKLHLDTVHLTVNSGDQN
jgi:hypothetical protein